MRFFFLGICGTELGGLVYKYLDVELRYLKIGFSYNRLVL